VSYFISQPHGRARVYATVLRLSVVCLYGM